MRPWTLWSRQARRGADCGGGIGCVYARASAAERQTALAVFLRTLGQVIHDRVQHERWINALETGVKNDARSVAKFIALPSNDGVPMYDKVEADETEIGQLLFAAPVKPKADAAKKYATTTSKGE